MEYRNKKTGAVISLDDHIQRKDWEPLKVSNPKPVDEPKEEKTEPIKKKGKK